MRKPISFLLIIFSLLIAEGCYTYNVVASNDSDSVVAHKETRTNFFWGLMKPQNIDAPCSEDAITKFTVKTNLGFQIISVATGGIIVPFSCEYWCEPEDNEPVDLPRDTTNIR